MLFDLSGSRIKSTPYPETFELLNRLTREELQIARDRLNEMIDGDEIHTSSWMPGSDWSDTPFHPIWEKAAKKNVDLAAKIFGVLVWDVFRERSEKWITGRFEKNGEPISGRTYFRDRRDAG